MKGKGVEILYFLGQRFPNRTLLKWYIRYIQTICYSFGSGIWNAVKRNDGGDSKKSIISFYVHLFL
jgi:hypothetical protein